MAHGNLRVGRRVIASLAAASMITTGLVAAPTAVVPTAFADAHNDPATAGTIKPRFPISSNPYVWIEGEGFAPRTEDQGLAVDLMRVKKDGSEERVSLPSSIERSHFTEMVDRGNGMYYGVIKNLKYLPNKDNGGEFAFLVHLPEDLPEGHYVIVVKSGSIGKNAPRFVKRAPFEYRKLGKVVPKVYFGLPDAPNIGASGQGQTVTGTFSGLPQGSKLRGVGILDEHGFDLKENWAPKGDFVADKDGKVVVPGITIPANAPLGEHISAIFDMPNGFPAIGTSRRPAITPVVPAANAEAIKVSAHKDLPAGLYQSVYDPQTKALYATVSDFASNSSKILKIDPITLQTTTVVDLPAPADKKEENKDAVFGLGLDSVHQTLWATNTLDKKVSVYRISDGKKLASMPLVNKDAEGKNKAHPRDVTIDAKTGKAYVSDPVGPNGTIFVFDTTKLTDGGAPEKTITIPAFGDRGAMELKLDADKQQLWTNSFTGTKIARIDLAEGNKTTVFDLGNDGVKNARGGGLALDTKRGRVFVVTQEPSQLKVVNITSGKVEKTIVTGGNPLDAIYDPVNDVVYTVNRTGGTVNLIDPEKLTITGTRTVAPYPNHLSTDGMGNVYLTTKPSLGRYPFGSKYKADTFYKLTVKDGKGEVLPPPGDGDSVGGGSSTLPGSSKPGDKTPTTGSSNNTVNSSGTTTKPGGSSASGSGAVGIVALVAAILGALGFAFHSGMLTHLLPPIPGLPQR